MGAGFVSDFYLHNEYKDYVCGAHINNGYYGKSSAKSKGCVGHFGTHSLTVKQNKAGHDCAPLGSDGEVQKVTVSLS